MNTEYKLYLDMDGVLVDFEGGFINLTNMTSKELADKQGKKDVVDTYISAGIKFWSNLKWIHGGKEVWDTAQKLFKNVFILSSTGTSDTERGNVVATGKRIWLKNNIPSMEEQNIFIVNGRRLKPQYASKDSILVDDMSDTIHQWNVKGGYGILHSSHNYEQTIEELEYISQPVKLKELIKRSKL